MAQVTGICFITIDGKLMRSKPGASLKLGGKERTAQMGHKVYGYSEAVVASEVELTLAHMADTDLIELRDKVNATCQFETDTGVTFLLTNCFVSEPPQLTAGEGDVTLKLMGDPAEVQ